MSEVVQPRENSETHLPALEASDAKYLRDSYKSITAEVRDGEVYFESKNKVGAIGVPSGASFYVGPKVECSLLHMLALSGRIDEEIVLDAEEAGFEFGDSFVDLIAQLYLHELRRIIRRGLDKQYEERQERLNHLRGRLDLQQQLRRGPGTTSFECVYDELTHDTWPNQFLYHAADALRRIVSNEALAGRLHRFCRQFEGAFDPRPLPNPAVVDVQLSHLNRYYERGIQLAELILQTHYVEGLGGQQRDLSSFLVDMPSTFEAAVYHCLDEAVSSPDIKVSRGKMGLLATDPVSGESRVLEPDFFIEDRDTNETLLVGDVKWKTEGKIERNDLFQLFAYQRAANAPGLLIYPDDEQKLPNVYEFEPADTGGPLYIFELDISDIGYDQTKERIINTLREEVLPKIPRRETMPSLT